MTPISETLHELLVRQGIAQERTAIRQARGIGAGLPGAQTDPLTAQPTGGEDREPMGIKAWERAQTAAHHELRQREDAADLNSERDRGNVTPAKFTGLHIVVDNSRNWRTQAPRVAPLGVRQFLVLVQ